jgi:hypothetical protein
MSTLIESNTAKDSDHPQFQPVPSDTEPFDCRRNTDTDAGLLPDATTEIVPSKALQICVPGYLFRPADSDLTSVIHGVQDEQDDCTVIDNGKLRCAWNC